MQGSTDPPADDVPGKYIDDKDHFPDQSLTVAPIYAKSPPYSQSCSISNTCSPIRIHTHFGVQTPYVLHVPEFPGNIFWICSLLHPLKKWSLRQTRGDSIPASRKTFTASRVPNPIRITRSSKSRQTVIISGPIFRARAASVSAGSFCIPGAA